MFEISAWPAFRCRNRYNRLLYEALRRHGVYTSEFQPLRVLLNGPDLLHLHWPDDLLNRRSWLLAFALVMGLVLYLLLIRLRGVRIVWTVHNLRSHEHYHPKLERCFWRIFPRLIDGYICLSRSARRIALKRWPPLRRKPGGVARHGHYVPLYLNSPTRKESRKLLGIPATSAMFLFFGQVRAYKNIEALIRAFRGFDNERAALVISGRAASLPFGERIKALARPDDRIRVDLRFLDEHVLRTHIAAADLVVLPYGRPYNSGAALMALSCSRPVLVPDYPTMRSLRRDVGADWVHTYRGVLDQAALRQSLDAADAASRGGRPDLSLYDWEEVAEATIALYRRVLPASKASMQ